MTYCSLASTMGQYARLHLEYLTDFITLLKVSSTPTFSYYDAAIVPDFHNPKRSLTPMARNKPPKTSLFVCYSRRETRDSARQCLRTIRELVDIVHPK